MNAAGCHTSIIILILLLVLSSSIEHVVSANKENSENLFPFLGYLQGFKLGQNLALELPPYVLSPIVILPTTKYQDRIPAPNSDKMYEQNDDHTRNVSYSKLSSNFNAEPYTKHDIKFYDLNERDFPVKEKRLADSETTTDSLRQADDDSDIDGTTEISEVLSTTSELINNNIENLIINNETTIPPFPYPAALYNNDFLQNLTITTHQIEYNITLPKTENNWKNFSLPSNISNVVKSDINSTRNTAEFAVSPTTQSSILTNLYPYPNAIFNSMVDRLSITTNPYSDEESNLPPPYNDRWQSFSSLTKLYPNSGFRPLAGLYYDGFLHKSLKKNTGFIPFGSNNYVFE